MWAAADDVRPMTVVEDLLTLLRRNDRSVLAHGVVVLEVEGREHLIEMRNEMDISAREGAQRVLAFTMGLQSQCILYGLFRRSILTQGIFSNRYGQEYLLCLQLCLLGTFEYLAKPMIIYRERRPVPNVNPMYNDLPITIVNLINDRGLRKWKCWTVLVVGSYYLLRVSGVSVRERAKATLTHVKNFCWLYRRLLAKEIVFQLFGPISWLSVRMWCLARRWEISFAVARKIRGAFLGA
jgi:hypothetical protein